MKLGPVKFAIPSQNGKGNHALKSASDNISHNFDGENLVIVINFLHQEFGKHKEPVAVVVDTMICSASTPNWNAPY